MPATNSTPLAERTATLAATPHSLGALHDELALFWQAVANAPVPPPSDVWRLQFATALVEVGSNIIRHAYADGAGQVFTLRLRLARRWVEARYLDTGCRYVALPRAQATLDAEDALGVPEGGYGLIIARQALDNLGYRRTRAGVNCWRLRKRLG